METCIDKLQEAKSDNEKFAAMLMVAKTTKSSEMTTEEKKRILDAIGLTFIIRLLKSDSHPEDCSANIYKSMALSVLSGLCADSKLVESTSLYRILKPLNEIIVTKQSNSEELENMVNDAFEVLKMFAGSQQGIKQLMDSGTISSLAKVISKDLYGSSKASDLMTYILHAMRPCIWTGQGKALEKILNFYAQNMEENQNQEKFELCNFIALILRVMPMDEIDKTEKQPWKTSLLKGIQDIFSSRLGEAQREPALKLVASLIGQVGMEFILPPNTKDNKVLLMIIHLSCIEVRITLENLPIQKVCEKADLLCACYHLLENIIIYLTTSPSLLLDEKQILQLHSAMLGAFHSIIFFLKELSDENNPQGQYQNPVVIATVRVLGAWLAEETSALRTKTYEILPFLLQICKLQLEFSNELSSKEENIHADRLKNIKREIDEDTQAMSEALSEGLSLEEQNAKKVEVEQDNDEKVKSGEENKSVKKGSCESESKFIKNGKEADEKDTKGKSVTFKTDLDGENSEPNCVDNANSEGVQVGKETEQLVNGTSKNEAEEKEAEEESVYLMDQSTTSVDLLRFLLPGLCHLTSEDDPRKILVDNELLPMLNFYLKRLLKRYFRNDSNDNVVKALELLCNIFLNFAVIEPGLVRKSDHLINVTIVVMEAVPLVGRKTEFTPLWLKMVTLGMFYLRHQSSAIRSVAADDILVHFFICACTFVKGAFINSSKNRKKDVLTVSPHYLPFWEEASQLWFLTIQGMTSCTSMYPQLVKATLVSGMMPQLAKVFIAVQGRDVGEEVIRCVLSLFITMAHCHEQVRNVIKTTGGLQLSKIYDSKELRKELGIAEKGGHEKKS